ncbi:uncharacterized protein PHALS_07381 [Plasmopara halstedii]|uniref:M96 mating-specific protein family n=1 Tax=Plasmopara halstedii TaxID=4781 RepID=A0A0P1B5K7_PLAHL|nr:uncharacterized protein PHALS_07381 [Plasmopara halstedii]CEG49628.1 hypothetical protein PHALS_07381 [Plasmopara halstedii]|eukprot:XP_024585997.1 hypothetical protein PHALS_07381 [Plasmopara halstedii]
MPLSTDCVDGVGALDDELLAALDDVLSISESNLIDDALSTIDNMTLGDEIDTMLSIGVPPLVLTNTPAKEVTSPTTPDMSAKSPNQSVNGDQTPPHLSKKGKEARMTPYSTSNKPRHRKRPKDELDYLRAKVNDMEEKLAVLQSHDTESPSAQGVYNSDASLTLGSSQDMLQRWKRIAGRQKKEVDRSVLENMRLRAMLEGQLNVARSLEEAIEQQQRESVQSLLGVGDGIGGSNVLSDNFLFARLNEGLDSQYMELDTIYELCGIAHVNCDMNNGTKVLHDVTGVSIRHEEVRVLPFSMDAVQRAIWSIFRYSTGKDMMLGPMQTQVVDENCVNITMREKLDLGSAKVANTVRRLAFRRIFEENRTVVIWSSYIEIDGSVFVRMRDKGYITTSLYKFGTDSFGGGVPGSVTRIVVLASPEMSAFPSAETHSAHIGEMTELVVGLYRVTAGLFAQTIDMLLLQEAMGGKMIEGEPAASPVPINQV